IGIAGVGLLKVLGEVLKTTVGEILEILQKGAGAVWRALLVSLDIIKAARIGDELKDPSYWREFFDDVYFKLAKPQARTRIDDCVSGIFGSGKTWADLSKTEKLNED